MKKARDVLIDAILTLYKSRTCVNLDLLRLFFYCSKKSYWKAWKWKQLKLNFWQIGNEEAAGNLMENLAHNARENILNRLWNDRLERFWDGSPVLVEILIRRLLCWIIHESEWESINSDGAESDSPSTLTPSKRFSIFNFNPSIENWTVTGGEKNVENFNYFVDLHIIRAQIVDIRFIIQFYLDNWSHCRTWSHFSSRASFWCKILCWDWLRDWWKHELSLKCRFWF